MSLQISNATVLTDNGFKTGMNVMVKNNHIHSVSDLPHKNLNTITINGDYLIPSFIDLQIYGGNDALFSAHPGIASLQATVDYSMSGGAAHILPTVATNSFEVMLEAIKAVRYYQQQGLNGVLGLHLEGPYIHPLKKGAHIDRFIKVPNREEVLRLLDAGSDVIKMMTLAPEQCSDDVMELFRQANIILSAGHSNADFATATRAFNNGIHAVTHLYNAMSPFMHRAPGLAGAAFLHSTVMASIVADGHHVDYAAIKVAKQLMKARLFLITDAVSANSSGTYQHRLSGNKYVLEDGTLSGSALTMMEAVKNCVNYADIPLEEACRMASLYPATVLGVQEKLGKIEPGYLASFIWLNKSMEIKGVYAHEQWHY